MRFWATLFLLMATGVAAAAETRHLSVGGLDRSYLVNRPASVAPGSRPALVVMLHGGFGSPAQAERAYGWDAQAEAQGFVLVYPEGFKRSWNAGGCCGQASERSIDDVGFLAAMIAALERDEGIDPRRVYLTGMSNGAAMAYRMACERRVPIAAVGAVSGSLVAPCPQPAAVSLLEIHGAADRNIPLAGGVGSKGVVKLRWLPVTGLVAQFRKAGRCADPSDTVRGPLQISIARCPDGRVVELMMIEGAGHQWPGGRPNGPVARLIANPAPPSTALDATATLWAFFADKRPPPKLSEHRFDGQIAGGGGA